MTPNAAIKKIDPEKVYSLNEIVRTKLLPPVKSYPTAYRIVLEDLAKPEDKRLINAQIIGDGYSRTIRIKGENLIAYLRSKQA